MKNVKKHIFVLAVLIIVVVYLSLSSDHPRNVENSKLTLGCVTCILTSHVWVADNKGYFSDNGIDLDIKRFSSGKAALEAMLSGDDIDICTVAQTPVVLNSFIRNDFVILGSMVTSDDNNKILIRKDSGIAEPADLIGKKVAVTKGTTAQYFLNNYFTLNELSSDEITIVDMTPNDMPKALKDHSVDAICVWEPFILLAQGLLGDNAMVLPTKGLYREDFYFVAKKTFIDEKPDAVINFMKAIINAEEDINNNPEYVQDIVSAQLNVDPQQFKSMWKHFDFYLMLDQTIFIALEDEARWAINLGLTDSKEVPNFLEFVYPDLLDIVDKTRVTIIN